jgi:hypothetical protein
MPVQERHVSSPTRQDKNMIIENFKPFALRQDNGSFWGSFRDFVM